MWVLPGHCMALVSPEAMPLVQNISDDSHVLQAIENSRREGIEKGEGEG